jgi:hypothetical protein
LGVAPPEHATTTIYEDIVANASSGKINKCLIYAPDALGYDLCTAHPKFFDRVRAHAPNEVLVQSVVPSVTPVCFASMFTGAQPRVHGIQEYERPVLKCDTLFDALVRAGKRVALVAVKNSSIDLIFRNRSLSYFSEQYDPEVTARVIRLMEENNHDLILAYHQEYDDNLHRTTPFSAECLEALEKHIASFELLAKEFEHAWRNYSRALFFTPDHGGHVDTATGKGTHGLDIPEDMVVKHFMSLA